MRSCGRRPALAAVSAVAAEVGALVGAHPTEQASVGQLDHGPGFPTPGPPAVIGLDACERRGAFISRDPVEAGVDEQNAPRLQGDEGAFGIDRKSTRLNS